MPPRNSREVAQGPTRADLLREYATSEREIRELRRLPLDEALFRIGHEANAHIAWARRKADFLRNEVRASRQVPAGRGGTVEFVQPREPQDSVGGMRLA